MWSLIFQAKSKVNKLRKDLLSVQQKRSRYVFVKNLETVKGEKRTWLYFFWYLCKQDLFVKSFSRRQLVLWKYKIKTILKISVIQAFIALFMHRLDLNIGFKINVSLQTCLCLISCYIFIGSQQSLRARKVHVNCNKTMRDKRYSLIMLG